MTTKSNLYTKREAQERLKCSLSTLDRAIKRGDIPTVTVGKSLVRIPSQFIDDLCEAKAK